MDSSHCAVTLVWIKLVSPVEIFECEHIGYAIISGMFDWEYHGGRVARTYVVEGMLLVMLILS